MSAVIWSPSALTDLQGIRDYIDRFNPKAASKIAARLIDGANGLKNFPQRGRPAGDNLREWTLIYPYIIRYQIVAEEVHVLGVRHGYRIVSS